MNEMRYIYFRRNKEDNTTGAVCVGYQYDETSAKFAFSFVRPRNNTDNATTYDKFSKAQAHSILADKMEQGFCVALPKDGAIIRYKDAVDIAIFIIQTLSTDKYAFGKDRPVRFRKWVSEWFKDPKFHNKQN